MEAFLFDVDGTLTDDAWHLDATVLDGIAGLVRGGHPVAVVTGRWPDWLDRHLLPEMAARLEVQHLREMVMVAELGAVGRRCDPTSEWRPITSLCLAEPIRAAAVEAVAGIPGILLWNRSERMVTAITDAEADPMVAAAGLDLAFERLLCLCDSTAKATRSTYAVDLMPLGLDKTVGATWALAELQVARDQQVWAFGDSPADLEMGLAGLLAGYRSTIAVWVGPGAPPPSSVPVVKAGVAHSAGTKRFLDALHRARSLRDYAPALSR